MTILIIKAQWSLVKNYTTILQLLDSQPINSVTKTNSGWIMLCAEDKKLQ